MKLQRVYLKCWRVLMPEILKCLLLAESEQSIPLSLSRAESAFKSEWRQVRMTLNSRLT
jgi:hypothetical protein